MITLEPTVSLYERMTTKEERPNMTKAGDCMRTSREKIREAMPDHLVFSKGRFVPQLLRPDIYSEKRIHSFLMIYETLYHYCC